MHELGKLFLDVLAGMFLIGLAGSALVVGISFVEDFGELFSSDEGPVEPPRPPHGGHGSAAHEVR